MASPRVSFVIGGVQKGGTTALSQYLSRHPGIRLPRNKEAHVFDAPDFADDWSADDIDRRYREHFDDGEDAAAHGDATPIYMLHPTLVGRIARYNPAMRWIIVLRNPADRAISQYYMERGRGDEWLPLPLALLAERGRLRGREADFSHGSPLRHHSYLTRGDYVRQLDAVLGAFPSFQVLILQNDDLRRDPGDVVDRVVRFLDLPPLQTQQAFPPVFTGDYHHRLMPRLVRPWITRKLRPQLRALRDRYGISFDNR